MHWRLRLFMDHIMHFNLSGCCLAAVTAVVFCVALLCVFVLFRVGLPP